MRYLERLPQGSAHLRTLTLLGYAPQHQVSLAQPLTEGYLGGGGVVNAWALDFMTAELYVRQQLMYAVCVRSLRYTPYFSLFFSYDAPSTSFLNMKSALAGKQTNFLVFSRLTGIPQGL